MDQKIGVGIAGYGLSGAVFHAPMFTANPAYALKAIQTSRRSAVELAHPDALVCRDFSELLTTPDVELIVIALPNFLHFEMAELALKAGKHVLLEKPFVPSTEQGMRLMELADKMKKCLSVFHNRRWDGDFLTLQKICKDRRIGEVYHYEAHFDRFRCQVDDRWKEQEELGGGIFYDLGSHLIDQAFVLYGEPEAIMVDLARQRAGAKQTDYFHAVLRYGQRRVILHGSTLVHRLMPRYLLHGDQGSAWKFGIDPQEDQLRRGLTPNSPGWGKGGADQTFYMTHVDNGELRLETQPGCYEDFYSALADAIRNGKPPPVSASDALKVIRAIELGYRSAATGRWIDW